MNESSHPSECRSCGATLPQSATEGLCPACLMAEAMVPTGKLPPAPAPDLETVRAAFPQLEVLSLIGRGGMGAVFKVRQPQLDRFVALKLLAPARTDDTCFAERFQREAKALAALSHPNIVTIHDFGQAGGFFYLLMEFVDGVNLREALQAGRFTPEQALAMVPPLCDALQFAHEHGVVHRDIKPENLLLDRQGRIKVADFGIARILVGNTPETAEGTDDADALHATIAAGTPGYMAPEQGGPSSIDSRADIYSLGVVLYEMLTGELPRRPIDPPSRKVHIDVRLDEVVLRALEAEPERRFQTVGELRTMVETIAATPQGAAANTPTANAGTPGTPRPVDPRAKRFGGLALALCIVAIAAPVLMVLLPVVLGSSPVPRWSLLSLVLATGGICWLTALIFGIIGWRSVSGKIAVVSVILLTVLAVPLGVIAAFFALKPVSRSAQEAPMPINADKQVVVMAEANRSSRPGRSSFLGDRVTVEHLALRLLAAIRDKEDHVLKDLAVDRAEGWREALPGFASEIRERLAHLAGQPSDLYPSDSIVVGDRAVVRCIGSDELDGAYLVLGFVRTPDGWRNWSLRNSPPSLPLQQHFDNFSAQLDKLEGAANEPPEINQ